MIADWEVAKTQGVCAGCGNNIEPGQDCYAALLEKQETSEQKSEKKSEENSQSTSPLTRLDYCQQCWQQQSPQSFCFWKTRVPVPAQKQKLLVDDEVLLDLFERLAKEDEQAKINFRFVLALILMRKRILKYERTELREGQEIWIMGQVCQQTKHKVKNPRLDDAQITEVSEQLSDILRSEL